MNETFEHLDRHLDDLESFDGMATKHKAVVLKLYVQELRKKYERVEMAASAVVVLLLLSLALCVVMWLRIQQLS